MTRPDSGFTLLSRCGLSGALVLDEIGAGDPAAAQRRLAFLEGIPALQLTEDARDLAHQLVRRAAIPVEAEADAFHVAIAAVKGMDHLLAWNCRHIANARTRNRIGLTCAAEGYEAPVLCAPEELMGV
jgi:hypothetical protein